MEEDGNLDELDEGRGELSDPVGEEAKHQPSLCEAIHTHAWGVFLHPEQV